MIEPKGCHVADHSKDKAHLLLDKFPKLGFLLAISKGLTTLLVNGQIYVQSQSIKF